MKHREAFNSRRATNSRLLCIFIRNYFTSPSFESFKLSRQPFSNTFVFHGRTSSGLFNMHQTRTLQTYIEHIKCLRCNNATLMHKVNVFSALCIQSLRLQRCVRFTDTLYVHLVSCCWFHSIFNINKFYMAIKRAVTFPLSNRTLRITKIEVF